VKNGRELTSCPVGTSPTSWTSDRRMIDYRYRSIKPHCGAHAARARPRRRCDDAKADRDFSSLTVVMVPASCCQNPSLPGLTKVHALFEESNRVTRFDTIVMDHILEHIAEPVALLNRAGNWLAPPDVSSWAFQNGHSFPPVAVSRWDCCATPAN